MSEAILKALMQLFALIIDIDEAHEISDRERSIIRSFLSRQLSSELSEEYMVVFEDYLHQYHGDRIDRGSIRDKKRTSLTAVRILGICEKINLELELRQKIYVVILLVEYIAYGIEMNEKELDFVQTVASAFNIEDKEYQNILKFVAFALEEIPGKDKVLLINNEQEIPNKEVHHICNSHLAGRISFLHIESVNTHILRYHGKEDLLLNGQHLQAGTTYTFEHGSSIRGQSIDPIYYSDVAGVFTGSSGTSRLSFQARNVEFRFKNSDNGIHDFNLQEESGKLVGIMGGSGVGKSTLLNVLNGNLKPRQGEILINGYDLYNEKDKEQLKGVIGFIPQDDLLIEDLTVYQNLYFNARLCLSEKTEEEIEAIVKQVLLDLDLYGIRDLKVGKPLNKVISGGQRKRVNIGLELLREPSVLFVDEPTSGLSSVDSEMVMNLLKEQVNKGKLVMVNIHQPSSELYKMFDRIIFMDKGGFQIYYGNPLEAVVYFKTQSKHANAREDQCSCCGNVDPDQILQIIEAKIVNEYGKLSRTRKVSPREWHESFRESIPAIKKTNVPREKLPPNHFSIPGLINQLRIFFTRDILAKLTNRQYILISLLEAPLLAVILGFFTKYASGTVNHPALYVFRNNENLPAYLLMSVIVFLFLGLTISSEEIIKDRKILQRESFLNLSRGSYLNAKILMMFLISAIQSLSYVLVGNLIFEIQGMTLIYWLILFSTSCFANMLGLNISAGLNSVITIYILVPFLLIPQILFSGVLVKYDKLHRSLTNYEYVPFIGDLMTSRWAYEALSVEQFRSNSFQKEFFQLDQDLSNANYVESLLIPTLENKLDETLDNMAMLKNREQTRNNILMLSRELEELGIEINVGEDLNAATVSAIKEELGVRKEIYHQKRAEASRAKMKREEEVKEKLGGIVAFSASKDKHHNARLEDLVLNNSAIDKIEFKNDQLIRKKDPAYMEPGSSFGRAHLYASSKMIGALKIRTLWFNAGAIWLFSILLYIALYSDALRKTLGLFENNIFAGRTRKK